MTTFNKFAANIVLISFLGLNNKGLSNIKLIINNREQVFKLGKCHNKKLSYKGLIITISYI